MAKSNVSLLSRRLLPACAALLLGAPGLLQAGDYALTFSSASQIVTSTGRVTTANFTFEAWFKVSAFIGENQIFAQYVAGHSGRMIVAARSAKPSFFINGVWLDANASIPSNTWTHIAVTRNGTSGAIYINGLLDKTGSVSGNALPNSGVSIGNISLLQNGFRGQIADVRAWNYARTQPEIFAAMNARLTGLESGLVCYWPVNDGAGTAVDERVANSDGTIAGGAAWTFSADLPVVSSVTQGVWSAAGGGNWSDASKWLSGHVPNGDAHWASFTNPPPSAPAINNDLADLQLGRLFLAGASGHTFSGSALTFTNASLPATLTASSGSHALDLPLTLATGGLIVESAFPAALAFSDAIAGPGALSLNPAVTGGGLISLTGANTFTGPASLGSGTLTVDDVSDAGSPGPLGAPSAANGALALGAGTLRFTGAAASTDRGLTINAPSRAAVLRVEAGGDLSIGGRVHTISGGQVKTGPGTLRYTYPGPNLLSNHNLNDALLNIGANGDGPTQGFFGFGIAEGRVVLGAAGQTNTVNSRIAVGLYTTTAAGAETAGELEVAGGVLNLNGNTLAVGRSNGTSTTAPAGLTSKIIVSGGVLTNAAYLSLGYNGVLNLAGFNARPVMEMTAGHVHVQNMYVSESTGSRSDARISGGALDVSSSLRLGLASNAVGTLTLSGGAVLRTATGVNTEVPYGGAYATGTLFLCGGTLQTRNVVRASNSGSGTVYFNGGTLKPNAGGQTLQNLTAAYVSTNGAAFDTSLTDYTVLQSLLHDPALGASADGGLTKSGANTLTLSGTGSTYTGPTTVAGGTLRVAGALPPANAVFVGTDGELLVGGSATQAVSAASLTLDGNGTLGFAFALDGSANDHLALAAPPALAGKRIALYQANARVPFTRNGTYTLLTYSGADPDTTGLVCANPAFGKTYAFSAASGALTVTIGLDTSSSSIWNVNAGGAWSDAGNWTVAPDSVNGSPVRFDSAISTPVTVTTAGEFVRDIYFNNPNTYTLGGAGLTLTNAASITLETGTHSVAAPLTLTGNTALNLSSTTHLNLGPVSGATATLSAQGNGTLALTAAPTVQALVLNVPEVAVSNTLTLASPVTLQRTVTARPALSATVTVSSAVSGSGGLTKAGSSTLELFSANTYTGPTTVSGGTLTADTLANGGAASSIGASASAAANLVLGPATFRYTGAPVTVNRGYSLSAGGSPVRAAVLRAEGDITLSGQCTSSSGALLKTGPGTLRYTYAGAQTLASHEGGIDALLNIGANGDSPTQGFSGYTVSDGKVILGVPGQTNTINQRITVGHYTTTAAGAETAGELQIDSGVLNCNTTVSIGRGNGTSTTAPGGRTSRLTVNGGIVNFNLLALGFAGAAPADAFNARPAVDVNAGTVTIAADARIAESRGAVGTLNVRGGTFRCNGHNSFAGLTLGGPQNPSGTGTLNLSGTGVVEIAHRVMLGQNTGGTGTLHLAGGTLMASNIVRGAGAGFVRFNGGTYMPRTPNVILTNLTAAYVSTNGALIDTSLADGCTVAQNLLADPALGGAPDGGLIKLGTNSLSLTGAGNTFNGPVSVQAGLLRARLGGTNDLFVATNAVFDALGLRCTVGSLTGYGLLTNGVLAVAGTLDAGTNSAPAGARMTLQNLSLLAGSAFACDWATNALGQVTNDFAAVSGTLTAEGPGFVDFGRTEDNPIPMPFRATILSYGSLAGSFSGWKARNTGLPASTHPSLVVTAAGGLVQIEVRYGGTLLLVK